MDGKEVREWKGLGPSQNVTGTEREKESGIFAASYLCLLKICRQLRQQHLQVVHIIHPRGTSAFRQQVFK